MKPRSWVQDMKSGFADASIGPSTRQSSALPTSAETTQRAVDAAVQKALDEQRERIADDVASCWLSDQIEIARAIRSGEIGGEQK